MNGAWENFHCPRPLGENAWAQSPLFVCQCGIFLWINWVQWNFFWLLSLVPETVRKQMGTTKKEWKKKGAPAWARGNRSLPVPGGVAGTSSPWVGTAPIPRQVAAARQCWCVCSALCRAKTSQSLGRDLAALACWCPGGLGKRAGEQLSLTWHSQDRAGTCTVPMERSLRVLHKLNCFLRELFSFLSVYREGVSDPEWPRKPGLLSLLWMQCKSPTPSLTLGSSGRGWYLPVDSISMSKTHTPAFTAGKELEERGGYPTISNSPCWCFRFSNFSHFTVLLPKKEITFTMKVLPQVEGWDKGSSTSPTAMSRRGVHKC